MERLLIVAAVLAVAIVVAVLAQRRAGREAPVRTGHSVPDHLDRADFDRPDAPWLVAVFSSATCATCADTWEKARHLEANDVAVQEIEVSTAKALHDRYEIDAVPLIVIADGRGARRASFLGPPPTAELWATMAELRG